MTLPGRVRRALPTGSTLPDAEFARRHRLLLGLLWLHVPALALLAVLQGFGVAHAALEMAAVALPAALASFVLTGRRPASLLVAFGLVTASAVTVHLSGGYIEAHFHFFVMIVALTLYEDWVVFGVAAGYVLLHHGVIGTLASESVYNHAAAVEHPWLWAGVHAGAVGAAGAFGVVAWRFSEDARQAQAVALERARAAEARALAAQAESQRAAAELERSNRDLEQFAYAASHDLSEPLRTVSSFVGLLERRYRDRIDDDATLWIEHVVDGSKRMQALIDDLLRFSRVGREDGEVERVDLADVVDDVRALLGGLLHRRSATLEVGSDLPPVHAHRGQLVLVLQNLVANGVKFAGERAPVVRVAAAVAEPGWVRVDVDDDGIGIAPEHRERVFAMFSRLHPRSQYEGTGIGLALCQRVVERHGGRIWVEDAPSGGARFSFTLPAA